MKDKWEAVTRKPQGGVRATYEPLDCECSGCPVRRLVNGLNIGKTEPPKADDFTNLIRKSRVFMPIESDYPHNPNHERFSSFVHPDLLCDIDEKLRVNADAQIYESHRGPITSVIVYCRKIDNCGGISEGTNHGVVVRRVGVKLEDEV